MKFSLLTTSDIGMLDFDISGVLQMNSIGVRASLRRRNRNVIDLDSTRAVKFKVALRAVYDFNIANCHIEARVES